MMNRSPSRFDVYKGLCHTSDSQLQVHFLQHRPLDRFDSGSPLQHRFCFNTRLPLLSAHRSTPAAAWVSQVVLSEIVSHLTTSCT